MLKIIQQDIHTTIFLSDENKLQNDLGTTLSFVEKNRKEKKLSVNGCVCVCVCACVMYIKRFIVKN